MSRLFTPSFAFCLMTLATSPALARTSSEASATIPSQFHGVWDAYAEACQLGSSDMRLSVTGTDLRFWETFGSVQSVAQIDGRTTSVRVKFASEGEAWTDSIRMALSEDGNALTISSKKTNTTRVKCMSSQVQ
jgi:hypothetical protein